MVNIIKHSVTQIYKMDLISPHVFYLGHIQILLSFFTHQHFSPPWRYFSPDITTTCSFWPSPIHIPSLSSPWEASGCVGLSCLLGLTHSKEAAGCCVQQSRCAKHRSGVEESPQRLCGHGDAGGDDHGGCQDENGHEEGLGEVDMDGTAPDVLQGSHHWPGRKLG